MIIIADNQPLTRLGMYALAMRAGRGKVVEDVASKKNLREKMAAAVKGVVVLDYTSFDFKGIEDFLILHKRFPDFGWVLCSSELSEDFIRRAAAEENIGIVFKDSEETEIVRALEAALHGSRYLSPQAKAIVESERKHSEIEDTLTHTELEVLKMIARGMTVKEIAAERISSTHTIITHKKNIFRKLSVNNVYEATKYALRAGLIEMMEYYI
ncbi:MAG: response regulator transcription factor [Muribaculaceae bacterium]|nr:response regulator transcription factor [Muribaculaceae bacterium]